MTEELEVEERFQARKEVRQKSHARGDQNLMIDRAGIRREAKGREVRSGASPESSRVVVRMEIGSGWRSKVGLIDIRGC